MKRCLTVLVLLLTARAVPSQEAVPRPRLSFRVDVTKPESGRISVAMEIKDNVRKDVRVAIPAWAPGAYRIVNYAKAVKNLRATGRDRAARRVDSVDNLTWKIAAGGPGPLTVRYELEVSRRWMDRTHCYLAGPDTYLYLVGRKDTPCRVRFDLPPSWRVGTGLERDGEFYKAGDYDTFIDCPTELGKFKLLSFVQDDVTYELVIHAMGPVNGKKLVSMCKKIVREQNRILGKPPVDRYVFLYHFMDRIGGRGLEHLNSTDITMSYAVVKAEPHLSASVTSHEYFHLWNVKRIRPEKLGPFDYTKPAPVKSLWFCEGVTSYFGDRSLARCGIWSPRNYLKHLAREIVVLQNNTDRKVTSVEKASWSVWTRKDWPRVDYYNKGELIALLMDLRIRSRSGGKKTLDDVMRYVYRKYCLEGEGPIGVGFPEGAILAAINKVTGDEWKGFFARYVSGVEELPYKKILSEAGLEARIVVTRLPALGVRLRSNKVTYLLKNGPAAKAGLKTGDRITAIEGDKTTGGNVGATILKLTPGKKAKLKLDREGKTVEVTVTVGDREQTLCSIRRSLSATKAQTKLLDAWLGKKREY